MSLPVLIKAIQKAAADKANPLRSIPLTQSVAKSILAGVMDTVKSQLKQKGSFELYHLGKFTVVKHAPRRARNVKTGAIIQVPAKNKLRFRPNGKTREAALKGRTHEKQVQKSKPKPTAMPKDITNASTEAKSTTLEAGTKQA